MGPLALELPGVIPRAEPSPSMQNNKFTNLPPKSLLGRVGVSCRVLFSLLISPFLGFQQFLRPLRGTRTHIACHPLALAAGEGLRTPGASRQRRGGNAPLARLGPDDLTAAKGCASVPESKQLPLPRVRLWLPKTSDRRQGKPALGRALGSPPACGCRRLGQIFGAAF